MKLWLFQFKVINSNLHVKTCKYQVQSYILICNIAASSLAYMWYVKKELETMLQTA